jgi:hypothetical protein
MDKNITLISLHSRKGGTGKTSVGLSVAFQLAARGHRVAYLDLDTQGSHLTQCLPLDRDMKLGDDGSLEFQPAPDKARPRYGNRLTLSDYIVGAKQAGRAVTTRDVTSRIELSLMVRTEAESASVCDQVVAACDNLALLLGSPLVSQIERVNTKILSTGGQNEYYKRLSDCLAELESDGYEFVVTDNSPGLSYNPGVGLTWAMEESFKKHRSVHPWFVTTAPWWDPGMILYELNVFADILGSSHPTLLVNRSTGPWLEESGFKPGATCRLNDDAELRQRFASSIFGIPLWAAADLPLPEKTARYLTPRDLSISVLRHDDKVWGASMPRVAANNGNGARMEDRMDFYLINFAIPAVKACCTPSGQSGERSFHDHMFSALVSPLLGATQEGQ